MPRLIKVVESGALHSRHPGRRGEVLFVVFSSTTGFALTPKFVMFEILEPLMDLCKSALFPFLWWNHATPAAALGANVVLGREATLAYLATSSSSGYGGARR